MTVTKKAARRTPPRDSAFQRSPHFKRASAYLAELAELESATEPSGGAKTARGKDKKAIRALEIARRLVQGVAGWAIDHQVGLALQLRSPVRQTAEPLPHRKYLSAELAKVDRHDHEIAGATLPAAGVSAAVARRALLNLLDANPGAFNAVITHPARHALRALDYNEVLPIFEPLKNKRKVSWSKLQKQRMAVLFVEHRVSRGMKRYVAVEKVANAFNVSTDTVRSWKPRLRREFGPLEMESSMAYARDPGDAVVALYSEKSLNSVAKSYVKLHHRQ
jgi:hypothetical protein